MKTELNQSTTRLAQFYAAGILASIAVAYFLATGTARAAEPPKPNPPAATKDAGKPVLGATMDEVDGKLQVLRVETGGPADRAGLRRGDVVLSIGSQQLANYQNVTTALGRHRPLDKVAIVVERDGATRTLQAVLGDGRAAASPQRKVDLPYQAAAANAAPATSAAPDASAESEPVGPVVVDGQDIGKTVQGFAEMLRGMTQGLRRSEPAGSAPTGRPRRPLLDRLGGTAPAPDQATPGAGDVQVDLGQEAGSSATGDLADQPTGPVGQAAKPRAAADEATPPRRALGTRPRPRLDRLRGRLGKALDGAEAPAFEGGTLQPNRPLVEGPTPRIAGRQPLPDTARRPVPEELPPPDSSQNRRASDQRPVDEKPALGVTLKLRDAGVVVSVVTPGGAAEAAGLKVGDVLTRIDGRRVASVREATEYIATQRPGDEVELQILREGRQRLLNATLGSRPLAR